MRWLTRLGKPNPTDKARFDAPVAPGRPFCVVGDIHGCMDLLSAKLELLAARYPDHPVIFVGDYVDRGPMSAEVLRALFALHSDDPDRFICLAGNHEDMMLGFLDDTLLDHRLWLQNGGGATLKSFGVELAEGDPAQDDIDLVRSQLQQALGDDLTAWLRGLPLTWQSGNVWVTHAGADPLVDMDRQDRTALLWGHPDFRRVMRGDDQWVVHGHTIVPKVQIGDGRVAIDTGAYRTGQLSAVCITADGIEMV